MDVAGTAVGIASLGIQICQGLLSYYDQWTSFSEDITATFRSIDDLSRTLILLRDSLKKGDLNVARATRVATCLQSCEDALAKLFKKAEKLRTKERPEGLEQRVRWEAQRLHYPFRASTLVKLQEIVAGIQTRLQVALQVLQLDISQSCQEGIVQLDKRAAAIEDQIAALQQSDVYTRITDWLGAPDPWTNYGSALKARTDQTGLWLLRSDEYTSWKAGSLQHIWLYGKPGCGKTILCSTVIEDIKALCHGKADHRAAAFFFTFSDVKKQTYGDLLRSLVAQFGWKEPGFTRLQRAYDRRNENGISQADLEEILIASAGSFQHVYLMLDALDESGNEPAARDDMLEGVKRLTKCTPTLKVFATSRDVEDVRETMNDLQAKHISPATHLSDGDIAKYVSHQLAEDKKLSKLSEDSKELIKTTISRDGDGMFRWAYCQLFEIKKLKWMKFEKIACVLKTLPKTLDETYERMLMSIGEADRDDAVTLLRWLAFARSPLTLAQLAETASIHLCDEEDKIDDSWKEDLTGPLNLLEGLILIVPDREDDVDNAENNPGYDLKTPEGVLNAKLDNFNMDSVADDSGVGETGGFRVSPGSKIRLSHFSVKEYLVSDRIRRSDVWQFYASSDICNEYIAQSCLSYLLHRGRYARQSPESDQDYPLLRYAAVWWFVHMSTNDSMNGTRAVRLLSTTVPMSNWLAKHDPDGNRTSAEPGSSLYYASLLGLQNVATLLIERGVDVNAQGGRYCTALQVASGRGHIEVARLLVQHGANVNAQGGHFGNALQAASMGGHVDVARLLVERGADINLQGFYGNALQAALMKGQIDIAILLIERGADINASPGNFSVTALHAAARDGHTNVVRLLIERGADLDIRCSYHGTALQAASGQGRVGVARLLIEGGADVNSKGGFYGHALETASALGYFDMVLCLLEAGATVNAQGGRYGTAIQAAVESGFQDIVKLLIDHGADVNAQHDLFGNALHAAAALGHLDVTARLLEGGAMVNAPGGPYGNALQAASEAGFSNVTKLLIDHGAVVNAETGRYGNALQAASALGHYDVVAQLLDCGAAVNAEGGPYGNALFAALEEGHDHVAQLLIERGASIGHTLQVVPDENPIVTAKRLLERGTSPSLQGVFSDDDARVVAPPRARVQAIMEKWTGSSRDKIRLFGEFELHGDKLLTRLDLNMSSSTIHGSAADAYGTSSIHGTIDKARASVQFTRTYQHKGYDGTSHYQGLFTCWGLTGKRDCPGPFQHGTFSLWSSNGF